MDPNLQFENTALMTLKSWPLVWHDLYGSMAYSAILYIYIYKYIYIKWKQWHILFSWAPKSLQMVTAAMKLKTLFP